VIRRDANSIAFAICLAMQQRSMYATNKHSHISYDYMQDA